MISTEECDCIACTAQRIFPPAQSPADRIPSIIGIDVSTKYIAIGIVPAIGPLEDVGGFGFSLDSKKETERCSEAADKALISISQIHEATDITSIAIEMPKGFGGKLIPIVGAVTAVFGHGNCEWYAPVQWQSVIKKEYSVNKEDVAEHGVKQAIHSAVANTLPMPDSFLELNEDLRDALCIAIAHRIEIHQSTDLTDEDLRWLTGNSGEGQ